MRLQSIATAVLSDAMDALSLPSTFIDGGVRRLAGKRFAGRARTVDRAPSPTNARQPQVDPTLGMGIQEAIDAAPAGAVMVIAARGDLSAAMWGGNMGIRARSVGVCAVVTDGTVRDLDEMDALGLAVFGQGCCSRQAYERYVTLSVGAPVIVGGVRISHDDILVGDGDGVVVIPSAQADEIAARAEAITAVEAQMQAFLEEGNTLVDAIRKFRQR